MLAPGISAVRIEVIGIPENAVPVRFAIQVGAFRDRDDAERCRALMRAEYGSARIILREGAPNLWRVLVGSETNQEGARALATRVRQGSAEGTAFVARFGL
jgi:cell division protein FtsN